MDAFGSLGSFQKRPEQMTLAERQKLTQSQKANTKKSQDQTWSGLDLLDSLGSNVPSPQPRAPSGSQGQSGSGNSGSLLDDFDVFASAPPKQPSAPKTASVAQDDPFAFFESKPAQRTPSGSQSVPAPSRPQPKRPSQPNTDNDHGVAQLVEMGFEPADARRALQAMDGSVNGAINYLMSEAQGRPLPKPKKAGLGHGLAAPQNSEELITMASDIGSSVFAAASSFWSKGRKQIQKTMEQYNAQPGSEDQPAWMRSQAKYMAKEQTLPQFTGELPPRPASAKRTSGASTPASLSEAQKSRAERFRERQAMRSQTQTPQTSRGTAESSAAQSRSATPQSTAPATPSLSSPTPVASPAAKPEPEVDLLGMSAPAISHAPLSSTQADMATTSRQAGSDAFVRGDYSAAATHFSSALQSIPKNHMLRTILLSNRAAAYIKVGDARGALDDTNEALRIINKPFVRKDDKTEIENGKKLVDVWVKLVTRQAQANEHLEKHADALASWKLLLDNGHVSQNALDAKRRCQAALAPRPEPKPASSVQSKRRGWGTTGAQPQSAEGKAAVAKVRNEHIRLENEEKERAQLHDKVMGSVDRWRQGKDNDLRALLSTLQNVLWQGVNWTPVSSAELVSPKKCRVVYMKAVARTHPDKIPSSASVEVKMIAQAVFITLNKAWETFREQNGL